MTMQAVAFALIGLYAALATIFYFKTDMEYRAYLRENRVRQSYEDKERSRKETYCLNCANALIVKRQRGDKMVLTRMECAAAPQCPGFEKGCGTETLLKEID